MERALRRLAPGLLWLLLMLYMSGCSGVEPPAATATESAVAQLPTPEPATATPSPIPATHTPPPPTATATSIPTVIPTATATATPTIQEQIAAATIRIQVEGSPYLEEYVAAGSGVIVDPSGLALTNYHLVEGAGFLQVTLSDGALAPAQVVGRSACDDVALLQLTGSAFPALPLNGEAAGELAVAGYPLGADLPEANDVTAAGQPVTQTVGFLDAVTGALRLDNSLDRGFSGGPLVSAAGSVVGLLSIGQPAESAPAYVIPASALAALLPLLSEAGDPHWLGMNVGPIPTGGADNENAPVAATDGLLVYAIDLRGPANAMGIRAGDVLLSLSGEALTGADGMQTFCRILRAHPPGEPLPVVVERNQARYLGLLNGAQLEQEVVALPPTATPAPATPPPAATEPPAASAGGLLEAMMAVRSDMQGLGGFLDGLMAGGCLNNNLSMAPIWVAGVLFHVSCIHQPSDCQRVLATHGRVVNAPRFGPDSLSGPEVGANNVYESAINLFASGTTDLVAACASLIQNPDSSISNLIVATARQRIGQAVDALNPVITNLQS